MDEQLASVAIRMINIDDITQLLYKNMRIMQIDRFDAENRKTS